MVRGVKREPGTVTVSMCARALKVAQRPARFHPLSDYLWGTMEDQREVKHCALRVANKMQT